MSRDIAAVMITVDRTPRQNYVEETLGNLARAGLFRSNRVDSLLCCPSKLSDDNRPLLDAWLNTVGPWMAARIIHPLKDYLPNENVARALAAGVATSAPWVLFLEDDIDTCADFFDSVGAWLDDHARPDRHIYAFGCAYPQCAELPERGIHAWHEYPIRGFWGTQAFAISSEDAASLSEYLQRDPYVMNPAGAAWDLAMHKWAAERWPEIEHFSISCPSFVEHIGRESVIDPRPTTHTFPSWPGREWSYLRARKEVAA